MIYVENTLHDYISVNLAFTRGSGHDPEDKPGLAYLTGQMLLRGTARRSEEEFQAELDHIGSNLDVHVTPEAFQVVGDCRRDTLPRFMELLSEMVLTPGFEPKELDRLKRLQREEIRGARDNDSIVLHIFLMKHLFEGHPFQGPQRGEEADLKRISIKDIRAWWERHICAASLQAGVAGNLSLEEAQDLIQTFIRGLNPGVELPDPPAPPARAPGLDVLLVTHPGRTQSQVGISTLAPSGQASDLLELIVANTAFGDTFTSPLVREIREKRGWSYGVDSTVIPGRTTGVMLVQYAPSTETTIEALHLGLDLLDDLCRQGLPEEEIEFAKKHLINRFPFRVDTPPKRLDLLMSLALTGRTGAYVDGYREAVARVTPAQANAAAARHLSPQGRAVVIVGDPSLEPQLRAMSGVTRVRTIDYRTQGRLPQ